VAFGIRSSQTAGEGYQCRSVRLVGFGEEVGDVFLHGAHGGNSLPCDLCVSEPLSDELCYFSLSAGQFIAAADFATIQQSSKLAQVFDYREQRGHYDSHSGAVIGEFLRAETAQQHLLHVNADSDGRYSVMLLMR